MHLILYNYFVSSVPVSAPSMVDSFAGTWGKGERDVATVGNCGKTLETIIHDVEL